MGVKEVDEIRITGGNPLYGTVTVQGSKNSALPMMAASLLHRGVSVLKGCPKIADVFCMEEILQKLGAQTWWKEHDLYLDCTHADGTEISSDFTGKMRSSVILLGALLGRNRAGRLGYPGGCVIGRRPIDLHLSALRKLGASIDEGPFFVSAECERLKGNEICFEKKSVGATEQAILGAVLARGETLLRNCACEPEIQWLCRYLRTMGAKIKGDGGDCSEIEGVDHLSCGEMQVPPDRIVAGTYLCACAATRGKITLENPPEGELDAFLDVYGKMGGQYKVKSGKLIADGSRVRFAVPFVETEVYPGFPTDLQSPLMAVLAAIPGESCIREQIFDARFKVVSELERMGARITVSGRDARIRGVDRLHGCTVCAEELRGGAALVLAALSAQGETVVQGYSYICRGYEHICEDLTALGGIITKGTGTYFYDKLPKKAEKKN